MSRSGYTDDCVHQGALNLWRANVSRSLKSPRGQVFLRELIEALDALPEKRLIYGDLVATEADYPTQQPCAIGAVGLKRGIDMAGIDPDDFDRIGKTFKIPPIIVQEIEYMNDEANHWYTPEMRWHNMRGWAVRNLNEASA